MSMTIEELRDNLAAGKQIWNSQLLEWYWQPTSEEWRYMVYGTCLSGTCDLSYDSIEDLWKHAEGGEFLKVSES